MYDVDELIVFIYIFFFGGGGGAGEMISPKINELCVKVQFLDSTLAGIF